MIKANINADEERGGVFIGEEVEFDLNIELIAMGISEEIINKEDKNTIYGNFKFSLQYSLNQKRLIEIEIIYKTIFILKDEIEDILSDNDIKEVIYIFLNNMGIVMLYPSFKNLAEILIREAEFVFKPIPTYFSIQ